MRIFKFPLGLHGRFDHKGPSPMTPISVGYQANQGVMVWCLCRETDPGSEEVLVERKFEVVFTGETFDPQHRSFIGTVVDVDGLVFHVYADI